MASEPGAWTVLSAVATGASHRQSERPCQDAVSSLQGEDGRAVAVAVADGHGHRLHFRSHVGARLAVEIACRVVSDQAAALDGVDNLQQLVTTARREVVPRVVEQWREAALSDLEHRPVGREELNAAGFVDDDWQGPDPTRGDPLLAYGSTLLLAAVVDKRMLLAQIGDGDIFTFGPQGQTMTPVPPDPALDGVRTTSMCQPDALDSFRLAALDLDDTPVAGAVLATDGYGNAQVADRWQEAVGRDLAGYLTTKTVDWLREQMPGWVANCASAEGSGDDTTMALLLGPDAAAVAARAAVVAAGAAAGAAATSGIAATPVAGTTPRGGAPLVFADAERTRPAPPPPAQPPGETASTATAPTPPPAALPPQAAPEAQGSGAAPTAPPPAAPSSRRRVWIGVGAVVAVAAVVVGVVLAVGGGSTRTTTAATTTTTVAPAGAGRDSGTAPSDQARPGGHSVEAKDPRTGALVVVPLPTGIGSIAQMIVVGTNVVLLSGDEVWRVPIARQAGDTPGHTVPLLQPERDLRGLGPELVTLSGKRDAVTYVVDLRTMTATCRAEPFASQACLGAVPAGGQP